MNRETRYAYCNKKIEVYKKVVETLEKLKPVIRSFDGKVYNKRFTEALDNKANEEYEKREFVITTRKSEYTHSTDINITLMLYDLSVYEEDEHYGNRYFNVDNDRYYIHSKLDSNRIVADYIIEVIDIKIENIRQCINLIEEGLKNVEQMEKEMQELIKLHDEYRKKYEKTSILDVFNCDYELKNMSAFTFR